MTLSQCSKADLIWIINRLAQGPGGRHQVSSALAHLEYQKSMEAIDKADAAAKLAYEKRQQYIDLLAPYTGMSIADIPTDILEKAADLIAVAENADKQWEKLMNIVDGLHG